MTVLVAGDTRVDAGKTTFSTGLVAHASAVGFKPRAGNDVWFHHDDYRKAVDSGTLYGKDARRLAAASPGQLDPTDVNPIHRLWTPSPGAGTGLLGQDGRQFVVDRVADSYVVNGTVEVPDTAREGLPLSDAAVVESVEQLNGVIERAHLPALARLAETIERTDRPVVESYADVARPIQGLEPDAVAVVEPRRVRIFDGSRYAKACDISAGGTTPMEGQLEKRVSAVVDLVDPVAAAELPPLTSDERADPDAVADAYDHAYGQLCAAADWEK
jgi:predicted P-loop ATPase/GTPase